MQTPADWTGLIPAITNLMDEKDIMGDRLRILTNYVDVLEKRVKDLEARAQRSRNSEKARKAYRTKTHWVTTAKRDLDTLKESRKREKKSSKPLLKGMVLYQSVREYMKIAKSQPGEANKILERIFGS